MLPTFVYQAMSYRFDVENVEWRLSTIRFPGPLSSWIDQFIFSFSDYLSNVLFFDFVSTYVMVVMKTIANRAYIIHK